MNLRIIALGKMKETYLQLGIDDYLTRLKPYARVELLELPESRDAGKGEAARLQALQREAASMAPYLREGAQRVVLAEEGKAWTSRELARYLESLSLQGKSRMDLVIGSHLGLAPAFKQQADLLLSLSALTFPHLLARLILLEQLYRCFKIMRGEPYHR